MMKIIFACLLLVLLPFGNTMGNSYMNISKPIEEGKLSIGVAKTDLKRKFDEKGTVTLSDGSSGSTSVSEDLEYDELIGIIGFGISGTGQLQGKFGNISVKSEGTDMDDYNGTIIGIGFRNIFIGDEESLSKGFIFQYLTSNIENNAYTANLTEIDIGFGISKKSQEDFIFFGVLILSQVSGEFNAKNSYLRDVENQSNYTPGTYKSVKWEVDGANELGIIIGGEFFIDDNMTVGLEMHNSFESGIAIVFEAEL